MLFCLTCEAEFCSRENILTLSDSGIKGEEDTFPDCWVLPGKATHFYYCNNSLELQGENGSIIVQKCNPNNQIKICLHDDIFKYSAKISLLCKQCSNELGFLFASTNESCKSLINTAILDVHAFTLASLKEPEAISKLNETIKLSILGPETDNMRMDTAMRIAQKKVEKVREKYEIMMNLYECLLVRLKILENKIADIEKTLITLFKCLAGVQRGQMRKKSLNPNSENISPFNAKPSSSLKDKSRREIEDDRQPLKKAKLTLTKP